MRSQNWVLLVFVLFILSAVLRYSELLLVALLVTTLASLSWLWNRFVLRRVTYTRQLEVRRAFVGEQVPVRLTVTNRKWLPVPWLRIEDVFPADMTLLETEAERIVKSQSRSRFQSQPQLQRLKPSSTPGRSFLNHLVSLGPNERVQWRYEIDCAQRGFYFFGPTILRSGDIFGLFSRRQRVKVPGRLIVYPRVHPLPELGFPGKEPFGEKKVIQHLVHDPLRTIGVREYRPEDTLKNIHWKASARHAELQVKLYEPTITQQLVLFLNVASFPQTWMGIIPEHQEQAISVTASIAYHATERRFAVGLVANGSVPRSDQPIKVLPGRDPDQLTHVLEALAAVTGFANTQVEKLLRSESPRLQLGATLIVITTVVTEELLAEILRLRDAGRRIVLVSMDPQFREDAPSGVLTHHIPLAETDFTGMWRRATAKEAPPPAPLAGRGRTETGVDERWKP